MSAALSLDRLAPALAALGPVDRAYIAARSAWLETARPEQIPPTSGWGEFGAQAGRGFGKTRMGAQWLADAAWTDPERLPRAVVAATQADVRLTCFEGKSGLLNILPPECVKDYNRTDVILYLTGGGIIRGFSAEKASRLRGPEHADVWADEIGAAWGPQAEDTLDMIEFGLRLGPNPRLLWTSTPKPVPLVRKLTTPQPGRIIVRGSTYDNEANLSRKFLDKLAQYEGTKLGRQEIYGELIDPEEAGIVKRSDFNLWPADKPLPVFSTIILSLDTAYTEKTVDKKGDPDPTACGCWGVFHHANMTHVMLLDAWEDHLNIMDLMRRVRKDMAKRYGGDEDAPLVRPLIGGARLGTSGRGVDILLIEDKGSGISLRQMLAESGIEALAYNPGRADKLSRLHIVSPLFTNKRVWLVESKVNPGQPVTWAEPVIDQLCSFAGEGSIKHDDHVDQTTQALRIAMDMQMLPLVKSKPRLPEDVERERQGRRPGVNPYAV